MTNFLLPAQKVGILLLSLIIVLSGCYSVNLDILHTDGFFKKKGELKKIIYIVPGYHSYSDDEMQVEDYDASHNKLKVQVQHDVKIYSQTEGFSTVIFTGKSNVSAESGFYSKLLPLKRAVMNAIRSQDYSLNDIDERKQSDFNKRIFTVNMLLPYELSALSKEFQTPYFAFFDVYSAAKKAYFIHVIVNVNLGRIEYQETKRLSKSATSQNIDVEIAQSFSFLKRYFNAD